MDESFTKNVSFAALSAMALDWALASCLLYLCALMAPVSIFLDQFYARFGEWAFVCPILLAYVLAGVLRFISCLIFGRTLGGFAAFVRVQGGFYERRLKGAMRSLVSVFTGLFPVFELLRGLGAPDIKSKLGCGELIARKGALATLIRFFVLPSALVLAFVSPLLQNLEAIDGLVTPTGGPRNVKLSRSADFARYKTLASNRYYAKIFTSLGDGRFVILPTFDVKAVAGKQVVGTTLTIYDRVNHVSGEVRLLGTVKTLELARKARSVNPLFKKSFKELDRVLDAPADRFKRKDYDPAFGRIGLLNPLAKTDVEELVRSSLGIGVEALVSHVFGHGPFLESFVYVRNHLLSLLRAGARPEADIVELGNYRFLRFRQLFSYDPGDSEEGHNYFETVIPLGAVEASVLQLSWDKNLNSALARKDFWDQVLAGSEWFFDFDKIVSFPSSNEEIGPMTVVDFFVKRDMTKEQTSQMEDFIVHYLFDQGRQAYQDKDDRFADLIARTAEQFLIVIQLKNSLAPNTHSATFINDLNRIKNALSAKDASYFGQ
jgi:hypothetical protein